MTELTKLSPALENSITNLEELVFVVECSEDREQVMNAVRRAKSIGKSIIEFFKESKELANKAHKAVCANESFFTDRTEAVEKRGKQATLKWDNEQADIRERERARAQAALDAKTRQERERLRKKAEITKTPERAEALLEEAEALLAPVAQVEEPEKNKGEATKRTWKAKVIDIDKIPREWMIVDMKELNAFAKRTKGNRQVPGVEFYPESTLAITI